MFRNILDSEQQRVFGGRTPTYEGNPEDNMLSRVVNEQYYKQMHSRVQSQQLQIKSN
jgi:hypothetical protein